MYFRSANLLRGAVMLALSLLIVTVESALAQTESLLHTETPAVTETVLYSFCSRTNCADGSYPSSVLILDTKGNMYGTTYEGGTEDCCGTVFKLTPQRAETVLHSFVNDGTDGTAPEAGLVFDPKGNLYGTTDGGGIYCCGSGGGTVFELSPAAKGWTEKILHSFPDSATDGYELDGGLIRDAKGNLYGTTVYGGTGTCSLGMPIVGCGTVFELSPGSNGVWKEKILYSFVNDGNDGKEPAASLIMDVKGNLYSTTLEGGIYDGGIVFELSPGANGIWTEKILHSFGGGNDASYPMGGVTMDLKGNLYGTSYNGGENNLGSVFEVSADGTETVLHSFADGPTDGNGPEGALIIDAKGNLYSTTRSGGSGTCGSKPNPGCGTVFELSPGSNGVWKEKILYSFLNNRKDGTGPGAGLTPDGKGNVYGTTFTGGPIANGCGVGCGTVFKLTP